MSAFLVSPKHIDIMLTCGINNPFGPLRWLAPDHQHPAAATLTDTHQRGHVWGRDAITLANLLDRPLTRDTADDVGAVLLAANVASVNHRYAEDELEEIYYYQQALAPAVDVLKAIDSFEYQSCEPPSWEHSEAKVICDALRRSAIRQLPGYDEAPWAP